MAGGLGSLKIEIGADIRSLQRSLKDAERALQGAITPLRNAAVSMSQAITLPLLGIGAYAIKAAGDMEGLKKAMVATMTDAGYSVDQATQELEALRVAALAPGLDLKQAVAGSMRLQNVGMSAEGARKTIQELANAVSMTGGTADDLDGVTIQMAQMISKGKVMSSDLRIIQERLPKISGLMQDAFGTSNAEDLQKMGVTGKQFVEEMTKRMEELPRVTGGISNSITNFMSSIQQSAAALGETLNKSLNVSGRLDALAAGIGEVVQWFGNLDDSTKSLVVGIGVFAASLGPLLFLASKMVAGYYRVIEVFGTLGQSMKMVNAAGFIASWNALNTAMKATIIGAAAAAIIALVTAMNLLSSSASTASQSQQALNEVSVTAQKSMVKEKMDAERLVDTIKSDTASRKEKLTAMDQLRSIAPDIFKNLSIEERGYVKLNAALDKYIKRITIKSTLDAAYSKLVDTQRQIIDAMDGTNVETNLLQKAYAGVITMVTGLTDSQLSYNEAINIYAKENGAELLPGLQAQRDALINLVAQQEKALSAMGDSTAGTKTYGTAVADTGDKLKGAAKEADEYIKALAAIPKLEAKLKTTSGGVFAQTVIELDEAKKKIADFRKKIDDLRGGKMDPLAEIKTNTAGFDYVKLAGETNQAADAFFALFNAQQLVATGAATTLNPAMEAYKGLAEGAVSAGQMLSVAMQQFSESGNVLGQAATAAIKGLAEGAVSAGQMLSVAMQQFREIGNVLGQAATAAIMAMGEMAAQGVASFAELARGALAASAKVIKAYVMQGVAAAMANMMASNPIGWLLAPAVGFAAEALFNQVLGSIGIPALAKGGLAYGPTMAMVGDNPGAGSNPEVIAPLNTLKDYMSPGNGGGELVARIDGRDLLILLKGAERDSKRTFGR